MLERLSFRTEASIPNPGYVNQECQEAKGRGLGRQGRSQIQAEPRSVLEQGQMYKVKISKD